jgi:hypothetical protein
MSPGSSASSGEHLERVGADHHVARPWQIVRRAPQTVYVDDLYAARVGHVLQPLYAFHHAGRIGRSIAIAPGHVQNDDCRLHHSAGPWSSTGATVASPTRSCMVVGYTAPGQSIVRPDELELAAQDRLQALDGARRNTADAQVDDRQRVTCETDRG